jgi:hypothetical protein
LATSNVVVLLADDNGDVSLLNLGVSRIGYTAEAIGGVDFQSPTRPFHLDHPRITAIEAYDWL